MIVTDADTGQTIYSQNADRYFMPASNAKLFTSAMALATLGPDFRIRTTIESAEAPDSAGVLAGDLVLVGRGDANLSSRVFPFADHAERNGPPEKALADLADQVVAAGVKEISGDIVADDSYFAPERYPSGWTIDDAVWGYGAAISALAVNDNYISVILHPAVSAGGPLTYTRSTLAGNLRSAQRHDDNSGGNRADAAPGARSRFADFPPDRNASAGRAGSRTATGGHAARGECGGGFDATAGSAGRARRRPQPGAPRRSRRAAAARFRPARAGAAHFASAHCRTCASPTS